MINLSVIVPVYNAEKYLSKCLDSLIHQTYKDIEIICVNDGSTDNSLEILKSYQRKDNRIKIITQENQGLSGARNTGLLNCHSNLVAFVDSDDFIDINTFDDVIQYTSLADIVCYGIKVFNNEHNKHKKDDDDYFKIKYKGLNNITDDIIFNNDVSSCNKIFKKDIIDKYGIKFPLGLTHEDAEFYCKYMSSIKTGYFIDKYYYHYRRTENSIMAHVFKGTEKAIHHLYITKSIFYFWLNNGFLYKNMELFKKFFISFFKFAYNYSTKDTQKNVIYTAIEYATIFDKECHNRIFRKAIRKEIFKKRYRKIVNFYEKIRILLGRNLTHC